MSVSMNQDERIKKYMKDVFDPQKPYTFISYSHNQSDVEKVYTLLDELMKKGINFAIDTEYGSKVGNWMRKMNDRLKVPECKCMMSFYSKSYVYSRPSLLEQLIRYSDLVKYYAKERKKTYSEEMKKELVSTKVMPSIVISLFGSKGIKKQIENKDEEQLERIKASKSDWELEVGSPPYEYFYEGLKGYFDNSKPMIEDALYNLGEAEELDCIRTYFINILDKEGENNTNIPEEVTDIVDMLASFGVKEDEVIKQSANALFGMRDVSTEEKSDQELAAPVINPGRGNGKDIDTVVEEPDGIRYRIAGKKYDAVLKVERKNGRESYIVESGSRIAPEWTAWVGNKKKKEITDTQSVDGDYRVIREVEFDTISAVGKFIKGVSTNGSGMLTEKNLISTAVFDTEVIDRLSQPDESFVPVEGARYVVRGKKYDAILRVENHNGQEMYVVEKGSRIAQDWEKYIGRSDMQKIQSENCVGEDLVLTKDTCFSAISTAGKFIKGVSTNGSGMVTEDHRLDAGFNDINTKKTVEGLRSLL